MDRIVARVKRSALFQFLEGLPPIDRATFWIVSALVIALALSLSALARQAAADDLSTPPADFNFLETRLA